METLYDKLKKYASVRMHMPGHKGNAASAPWMNTDASLDITEISGFDNLHDAHGILAESMEKAAALWHSDRSFYLVNGSTCGILAGIGASVRRGDKIICARGCHMSVFHAIELFGLRPVFFIPPRIERCGAFASADASEIERLIGENPDARLVVLTSPTYEGVISDVAAVCRAAHRRGMAVLVDEAHGAHLDLSQFFTGGAVSAGADITVQSLHKTLPCPTQSAILHTVGGRVDIPKLCHMLSVFETSSPSYLFLAAADGFVNSFKSEYMETWSNALDMFYKKAAPQRLLLSNRIFADSAVYKYDKSKIVISAENTAVSGGELAALLRGKFNIETEMSYGEYCLAMTGMGDSDKTLSALADALNEIDAVLPFAETERKPQPYSLPDCVLAPCDALLRENVLADTSQSAGKISAEYVWAYPPGIPVLIPGERISEETAKLLSTSTALRSTSGCLAEKIAVIR